MVAAEPEGAVQELLGAFAVTKLHLYHRFPAEELVHAEDAAFVQHFLPCRFKDLQSIDIAAVGVKAESEDHP
ncbi:MAG: hypothetical protein IKP04_00635 [Candidatus Methanomethylophilaceae archaeon]|nr:hypothetical protein [Candidatus Methanomethylophilaceae archaeon]